MQDALFSSDSYVSPERTIGLLAKLFPSLYFYPHLLWILLSAGLRSRKKVYSGEAWARSSEDVVYRLEEVGCRFEVTGLEHIHALQGPCVLAANHMSTLETMVMASMIQPWCNSTFVIKRSLYNYPIFRHVLDARQPICVDRVNPRDDLKVLLEEGTKRLQAGTSVMVFPQSTRQNVFDPVQFNSIAVKLAKRAEVPVIPLALYSAAWSEGRLLADFGPILPHIPVRFHFGAPFTVSGSGKEEQRALTGFIHDTLVGWGVKTALES